MSKLGWIAAALALVFSAPAFAVTNSLKSTTHRTATHVNNGAKRTSRYTRRQARKVKRSARKTGRRVRRQTKRAM